MTSGPNFPGVETASSKKDAVKKAFNQEYQATMKAMANAADRARTQILDQKLAAANHSTSTQDAKAAVTQSPSSGQSPVKSGGATGSTAPSDPGAMVMIEIANELRRIIVAEIDMRMNHLAKQVEEAIASSLPATPEDATSSPVETFDQAAIGATADTTAKPDTSATPPAQSEPTLPENSPDPQPPEKE
ncbi:hypothetical protein ACFOY8_23185 [Thalassospira xianhensis]|uniref:Uncharacterized protein n=1 Tax=Thalassospira xianhensis MCCC 1A02616 TaxID=1177929 RepID=A0A367UHM1_9PROT|nr:hypothetical protein [Thalassospira xianhensis]RCK06814.1 hypothetical protein TH5_06600 [Thalassospira xianhensis MCCC 1A02616]